jgi:hypothetical protein
VIGWYARRRILALDRYSTEGFTSNGIQPPPTEATKRSTANFFALHYGGFHFVYLLFLFGELESSEAASATGPGDLGWFALIALGFVISHGLSHRLNVQADLRGERNIGALMFLPYARIVPMHLMIIFGARHGSGAMAIVAFMALKTAADALMHWVEHRWLQTRPLVDEAAQ